MFVSRRALIWGAVGTVLCPALLRSPPAGAAVPMNVVVEAQAFITELANNAIGLLQRTDISLEQRETEFRKLLSHGFAMEFIGRFVLGRAWRTATPEQQQDYLAVFTEYVLKTYSRRLGGYSGEQFNVTGARAAGKKDVLVQTRIDRPSAAAIVADWRVRQFDGQYKIIDIAVEGVSMAVTQRSEFAAVVSRNGLDGLVQALRARTQRFPAASS
ncbi:MAG: ABC transporter substrate-binding protein [Alphaproteobacteria bacterium]